VLIVFFAYRLAQQFALFEVFSFFEKVITKVEKPGVFAIVGICASTALPLRFQIQCNFSLGE
jgi:hypothetical protein